MNVFTCTYESPLGTITAAAQEEAIIGLWFNNQKYFPADVKVWQVAHDYPVLTALRAWLDGYFGGDRTAAGFTLAPAGSEFRQKVWQILLEIPYGGTTTYGTIAKQIAAAQDKISVSAQAVGGAVGHNPISILIPCHRVVSSNGSLTGYAGGLDKKQALLDLEHNTILH
jgi:methylated-DNA-[protein]-cysteine S-methyltransferase